MRELLSKKSHRQLELLEILFENKRWFHISELAELLNCTERSVKDDLSHVRFSFSDLIFHSSTNGIRIINTDDSDIEMVYHHFFKHSTHFSILEFVMSGPLNRINITSSELSCLDTIKTPLPRAPLSS